MKRYVIGLNVNTSAELPQSAADIQAFIDTLGIASETEIQVSINPLLTQAQPMDAIGFRMEDEGEDEIYDDEEDED